MEIRIIEVLLYIICKYNLYVLAQQNIDLGVCNDNVAHMGSHDHDI